MSFQSDVTSVLFLTCLQSVLRCLQEQFKISPLESAGIFVLFPKQNVNNEKCFLCIWLCWQSLQQSNPVMNKNTFCKLTYFLAVLLDMFTLIHVDIGRLECLTQFFSFCKACSLMLVHQRSIFPQPADAEGAEVRITQAGITVIRLDNI